MIITTNAPDSLLAEACEILVQDVGYRGARIVAALHDAQLESMAGDVCPAPAKSGTPLSRLNIPVKVADSMVGALENIVPPALEMGEDERDLLGELAADIAFGLLTLRDRQVHTAGTQEKHREPCCRGGTVLVMDDDPAIRKLLELQLDRWGYRVVSVADGAEALEAFHRLRGWAYPHPAFTIRGG